MYSQIRTLVVLAEKIRTLVVLAEINRRPATPARSVLTLIPLETL